MHVDAKVKVITIKWITKQYAGRRQCTINRTSFKVKKLKVMRIKPNGKTYELQTWYTYEALRPISPTSTVSSKVKGQGRKDTWSVWQMLVHKSRTKSRQNMKLLRRLPTPQAITRFEVKSSKVKVIRPINAETESVSPTNIKLGRRLEHVLLSTAIKAIKVLWSGRGNTVSATPANATQLVFFSLVILYRSLVFIRCLRWLWLEYMICWVNGLSCSLSVCIHSSSSSYIQPRSSVYISTSMLQSQPTEWNIGNTKYLSRSLPATSPIYRVRRIATAETIAVLNQQFLLSDRCKTPSSHATNNK